MSKILMRVIFLSMLLTLMLSCSKDENKNPTAPEKEEPPVFEVQTVTIPTKMQQSPDPQAQMVVAYVGMINSFANFQGLLVPPNTLTKPLATTDGPSWSYTWVDQRTGVTVTLTISQTQTHFIWDVVISGEYGGVKVNNWKILHAERTLNGDHVVFTIYEVNNTEVAMILEWTNKTDGSSEMIMTVPTEMQLKVLKNADNSGSLEYYEWVNNVFVMTFKSDWTATGSGQWWSYNQDGQLKDSGSWG